MREPVEIVKVLGPPLIAEVVAIVLFLGMLTVWAAIGAGA